jgi:hypothetical protein
MTLRIVGAGLGRTGTNSLKVALEVLLHGRCYHMYEAAKRDADTAVWAEAVRGEQIDWDVFLREFVATVDWPACAFWAELQLANPGAFVLLSTRESPEAWWGSMERTIIPRLRHIPVDDPETTRRRQMMGELMCARFTPNWTERDPAIAAYKRHNDEVRRRVASDRLIDWEPRDGWEPICSALEVPVPAEPFPHVNTTAEFISAPAHPEGQGSGAGKSS